MKVIRMAAILCGLVQNAFSKLPDDPRAYAIWENEGLESIREAGSWPAEKAIPELGRWVFKFSLHFNMEKGDRPVFTAAQTALLAIPGHAEWYGEEIKRLTELVMPENGGYDAHKRLGYYATLEQLPSPETVKVLGELIFDERDPWKDGDWGDGGRPMPNSVHATKAFTRLGIRNAPVRALAYNAGDQRTWQLWFEQVKAGSRTFSFEGDDTVYSLAGPLRTSSAKDAVGGERHGHKSNNNPEPHAEESTGWILKLSIALVSLAAAFAISRLKRGGRSR